MLKFPTNTKKVVRKTQKEIELNQLEKEPNLGRVFTQVELGKQA